MSIFHAGKFFLKINKLFKLRKSTQAFLQDPELFKFQWKKDGNNFFCFSKFCHTECVSGGNLFSTAA